MHFTVVPRSETRVSSNSYSVPHRSQVTSIGGGEHSKRLGGGWPFPGGCLSPTSDQSSTWGARWAGGVGGSGVAFWTGAGTGRVGGTSSTSASYTWPATGSPSTTGTGGVGITS